jgi:arabinose-5-phosphate isomerase
MITYFEQLLGTIGASLQSIKEEDFNALVNDCVDALEGGHKVVVSGLGKNVPICDKFVGTMVSLGLDAQFLHTNSAIHGDMGIIKDGDIVIILTKSGETSESIYLSRQLRSRKAIQWLLTFESDSTLMREIDKHLQITMDHEGDMWNIMPNNSTTLNLIVLQAVAMQIARRMNLTIDDFKRNHPGGHIGELLRQ